MKEILVTCNIEGVEYQESEEFTQMGGFLMTFGEQRRITINARLPVEEKARGLEHLLAYLAQVSDEKAALYVWVPDDLDHA